MCRIFWRRSDTCCRCSERAASVASVFTSTRASLPCVSARVEVPTGRAAHPEGWAAGGEWLMPAGLAWHPMPRSKTPRHWRRRDAAHRRRWTRWHDARYNSGMDRPLWSRAAVLLIALLASLVSPGLAVAHGLAHAHMAEGHGQPAQPVAEYHQHPDGDDHDDVPRHTPPGPAQPKYPGAHERDHGHGHEHATVAAALPSRVDIRTAVDAPEVAIPVTATLAQPDHSARPAASWDRAALARPAPHSGPPPALRAPPAR